MAPSFGTSFGCTLMCRMFRVLRMQHLSYFCCLLYIASLREHSGCHCPSLPLVNTESVRAVTPLHLHFEAPLCLHVVVHGVCSVLEFAKREKRVEIVRGGEGGWGWGGEGVEKSIYFCKECVGAVTSG